MATIDLLVWVDCEMTGLDLINDELIEVAALVTDADLNVLGEGVDLVIKPSNRALEQMGDFVRGMHEASGLLSFGLGRLASQILVLSAQRDVPDEQPDDGKGRYRRQRSSAIPEGTRTKKSRAAWGGFERCLGCVFGPDTAQEVAAKFG